MLLPDVDAKSHDHSWKMDPRHREQILMSEETSTRHNAGPSIDVESVSSTAEKEERAVKEHFNSGIGLLQLLLCRRLMDQLERG